VLVTGCADFLGQAITRELLNQDAQVIGLVRDKNECGLFADQAKARAFLPVFGSVENRFRIHSALAIHEVSYIFHHVPESPDSDGTVAVLQAATLYNPELPVVLHTSHNAWPRAELKQANATAHCGVARFGELFGACQSGAGGVIARAARSVLERGADLEGENSRREFVHIDDAALACLALAQSIRLRSGPLDVTFHTGWKLTPLEVTRHIKDLLAGHPRNETFDEPPSNPLGWRPRTTFTAALEETVAWHQRGAQVPQKLIRFNTPRRKAA
jgi:nucleoside-diphosphate-sugar epimerase